MKAPARDRILVLAVDGASTWVVVHKLREKFPAVDVVIENKQSPIAQMRHRAKVLGFPKAFGQLLFVVYGKFAGLRSRRRNRELLEAARLNATPLDQAEYVSVESVNSESVKDLIRRISPAVVVVNGTRIIRSSILECSAALFINTHFGITPMYRGVHGGYWARVNRDPGHCGVTVHLVDSGVDTGDILYQARIEPDVKDNFFTYPTLQLIAAMPLLVKAVSECLEGHCEPRPGVEGMSRQWYHPTLWGYLRVGLRERIW